MNNLKRAAAIICSLGLVIALLAGCAGSQQNASTEAPAQETVTEAVSESSEAEKETETESETETEKETLEALVPDADGNVTITDMAGREVTFPANPMYWTSSPSSDAWLMAIAPEQCAGFAAEFTEEQRAFYPESVRDLETIGGNYGDNRANTENILAVAPQVIINAYDCSEESLQETITSADEAEQTYGIPVIVLDRAIEKIPEVAKNLGLWLGKPDRGLEVSEYLQGILDDIDDTLAAVPEDKVVTYYYAEGMDGLSTEAADSFHADVYIYCGLIPVVGDELERTTHAGMEAVSLEQVLQWNPEYIFVWNSGAYDAITTGEEWKDIQAVQNGNVYLNPGNPINWVDRPPNAFRILGTAFTAAKCYPDYCTYDLEETVKDFFDFMFGVQLTDEQMQTLLP